MVLFGSDEVRKLFFDSEESVGARLNHGSYGLSPAPVMKKRLELIKEQEQQPDVWFRTNLKKYYTETVAAAASFIDADIVDTFVIDNTTTGINYVLKSLNFEGDDEILVTSHTYLAIRNTVDVVQKHKGCKVTFLQFSFPISHEDDIVELYEKELSKNRNIKLAILDHITSPSAIVLPIKKLINLCRKYNVISVIDGAHAPGQIQLSMKEYGADFYCGNFYKWMYTARSSAFLWVSPSYRGQITPLVTSNHIQTTHHQFAYLGTKDYSSFYTLPTAIKFYKDMGGVEAITKYADELLSWAQPMLAESLGTQSLAIPRSMRAPSMAVVALPQWPKDETPLTGDALIVHIWNKYSVQVAFPNFNDRMWLRICANIYNTKDDFLKLRDSLVDFYRLS